MVGRRNGLVTAERTLKALANCRRLAILQFLHAKGPSSVGTIAEHIRLSFAATSRHLRALATAELVESEQVNTTVFYTLPKSKHSLLETTLAIL